MVSKANSNLKKPETIIPFSYKRCASQIPYAVEPPNLRTAKSYLFDRSKRISKMNRISGLNTKDNIFTLETNLSDFTVLRQLGEGCFAKVYKVEHV